MREFSAKWAAPILLLICSSLMAQSAAPGSAQDKQLHSREFWLAIVKNHYAVPEGQSIFPLLRELSGYLGSSDPELRDDLAYTISAVWIKHQAAISTEELNALLDEWLANLRVGIGESGTDGVLKRSFSALSLAALAERDLKTPFLTEPRFQALLAATLAYMKDERDVRGFDPKLGWIHSAAHTADLLGALASNPLLGRAEQSQVLEAISGRLSSAHEIFSYGEQDRLALAAARIVSRKDFDAAGFEKWLTRIDSADRLVWNDSPPKLGLLQTFENDTYMLRALAVYICAGPPEPSLAETQSALLKTLQWR